MITDADLEKVKNLGEGDVICTPRDYVGVVLSVAFSPDGVKAEILRGGYVTPKFYPYGEWIYLASEINGLRLYELGL